MKSCRRGRNAHKKGDLFYLGFEGGRIIRGWGCQKEGKIPFLTLSEEEKGSSSDFFQERRYIGLKRGEVEDGDGYDDEE